MPQAHGILRPWYPFVTGMRAAGLAILCVSGTAIAAPRLASHYAPMFEKGRAWIDDLSVTDFDYVELQQPRRARAAGNYHQSCTRTFVDGTTNPTCAGKGFPLSNGFTGEPDTDRTLTSELILYDLTVTPKGN